MSREHYLLLAGFLCVVGLQLGTLEHGWQEAMTPAFLGSTCLQMGILLRGFFTEKPQ